VGTYDWLLFLHLLGAVAVVSALVFYSAVVLGVSRGEAPGEASGYLGLVRPAGILFDVGGALLLVFGIWLAFEADYGITDEWVLGALVLWVIAAYAGTRTRIRLLASRDGAVNLRAYLRERRVTLLYLVTVLATLAMLALMIFKPGAK
jgi:uncharacterized membrane protein